MADVYIDNKKVRLDPSKSIGKGGEADVYEYGGKAVKIFKGPKHQDYAGLPHEQSAATARLKAHQTKLAAFPKQVPAKVVSPESLVRNSKNQIVGYVMKLIPGADLLFRYSEKSFRSSGADDEQVASIFQNIHETLSGIHKVAVIGDNNDMNCLIVGTDAYFIDADSWQYGKYLCPMFTANFVDPLVCHSDRVELTKPHNEDSDWYAFNIMLFECLLYTRPYDGVYIPKKGSHKVAHGNRPLHRISVFHPDVKYPKPARKMNELSDSLRSHFHDVFVKDKRGAFPAILLQSPYSYQKPPSGRIVQTVTIKGSVKADRMFETSGVILFAALQSGKLKYLYHEDGAYRREENKVVHRSKLDPQVRYRIHGKQSLFGKSGKALCLEDGQVVDQLTVDSYRGVLPVFDSNGKDLFWLNNGFLTKRVTVSGVEGIERIGDVLSGQTLFWAGKKFGFGFYRAGEMSVAFTFRTSSKGINDRVKLPPFRGQLLDSTCYFADEICWFLYKSKEGANVVSHCVVISEKGEVLASIDDSNEHVAWLENIRGKTAAGKLFFSSTDEGLKRIELHGSMIAETKDYPDTEPFVDSSSHLFLAKEGIYAVDNKAIRLLTIT